MPHVRIVSELGGWTVEIPILHGPWTDLDIVKSLKARAPGITGMLFPGGIVQIDADKSQIPVDLFKKGE